MARPSTPRRDVVVRPALPADAEGIASIFLDSAAHHAALDAERYAVPDREPIVARYRSAAAGSRDAAPAAVTLVAEAEGELAGFADIRLEQSQDPMHRRMTYCHIVEIAVGSRHRSGGIGRELLTAAEEWGRRRGATFASLEYHVANTRAAAFYHGRMGYSAAATIAIKRLQPGPDAA